MPNLVVYEDKSEEPQKLILRLRQKSNGKVHLCAVEKNGDIIDGGILLSINPNGSIRRIEGVSSEFGLDLNHNGQIADITPR